MARVIFKTDEFEASHGRAPRGRGSWAFAYSLAGKTEIMWSPSMTYGEAKKWARQEAARRGLQARARAHCDNYIFLYVPP